jgi:hypothetical protein
MLDALLVNALSNNEPTAGEIRVEVPHAASEGGFADVPTIRRTVPTPTCNSREIRLTPIPFARLVVVPKFTT